MRINRRVFVKQGALSLVAMGLPPDFLMRPLLAGASRAAPKKTLICIFQRGAVDGLSMVVPFGERAYYRMRRGIAVAAPGRERSEAALDLDGQFGLHPALTPLHDLYSRDELAIVQAVGSPHPTRSHFDAQDFMETGTPGERSTREGWLNRVLQQTGCGHCGGRSPSDGAAHRAHHAAGQSRMASDLSSLRGIATGASVPRSLKGKHPTLAIPDLDNFGVMSDMDASFERLYRTTREDVVSSGASATSSGADAISSGAESAFEAIRVLDSLDPSGYGSSNGAEYPNGDFGQALRQIAQLIKADVGVEVAFADMGGWDTHVAQGGTRGQLAGRLGELALGIGALCTDLGDRMENVVILTMSEFGRTAAENGSGGTDHGHANVMFAIGGPVDGGKILGEWPGLKREQLYEGRDLVVTTDFRDVFAEVAREHLGASDLESVFPGFHVDPKRSRGVLR